MTIEAEGDLLELLMTGNNRRYKNIVRNTELFACFKRVVNDMKAAENIEALKNLSYMHYEKLKYELSGLSSVRLSNRYVHRLIFEEKEDLISLKLIEIDDTHYGNKK